LWRECLQNVNVRKLRKMLAIDNYNLTAIFVKHHGNKVIVIEARFTGEFSV